MRDILPKNWKDICMPAKVYIGISVVSFFLGVHLMGGFQNYKLNLIDPLCFILWFLVLFNLCKMKPVKGVTLSWALLIFLYLGIGLLLVLLMLYSTQIERFVVEGIDGPEPEDDDDDKDDDDDDDDKDDKDDKDDRDPFANYEGIANMKLAAAAMGGAEEGVLAGFPNLRDASPTEMTDEMEETFDNIEGFSF